MFLALSLFVASSEGRNLQSSEFRNRFDEGVSSLSDAEKKWLNVKERGSSRFKTARAIFEKEKEKIDAKANDEGRKNFWYYVAIATAVGVTLGTLLIMCICCYCRDEEDEKEDYNQVQVIK